MLGWVGSSLVWLVWFSLVSFGLVDRIGCVSYSCFGWFCLGGQSIGLVLLVLFCLVQSIQKVIEVHQCLICVCVCFCAHMKMSTVSSNARSKLGSIIVLQTASPPQVRPPPPSDHALHLWGSWRPFLYHPQQGKTSTYRILLNFIQTKLSSKKFFVQLLQLKDFFSLKLIHLTIFSSMYCIPTYLTK